MQPRQYVDLDLTIETDGDGYLARVDSSAGQGSHRFELPFNNVGLENFILKLGHSRSVTRRARSTRREIAREFGSQLYRAVFDEEVEVCFRSSLNEALRSQRGLRIRLRIAGAPALAEIPWEYLYSEGLNRFVALSSDTPLVRFLDLPSGSAPLTVEPPLRVLVMVSSPSDLERLDVDREVALLRQATSDLTAAGAIELEVTPKADLRNLLQMLRVSPFHVFHFIGHGVFDENLDDGFLLLEDEDGRSRPVSGLDLGVLLHDHHSLRLAVLNACEGARGSVENPLGGVAQTLIRQGLPAAVAMQFEISDEAALVFAHEFYLAIADGYPIDAATGEARKAIFATGSDVEWGTPVLHLRATDGKVFEFTHEPSPELRLDSAREAATLASAERRFADAVPAWEPIVEMSPEDEAAALMLERARHGMEASGLYTEAATLLTGGNPEEALAALERVAEFDPDHGDPDKIRGRAEAEIAQAERLREQRMTEGEDATPTPEPVAPEPQRPRPSLWTTWGGVGMVLLAVAIGVTLTLTGDDGGSTSTIAVDNTSVDNNVPDLPPGTVGVLPVTGLTIDGNPGDWPDRAATVSDETVFPNPGADPRVAAAWLTGWDEEALYVVAQATDSSIDQAPLGQPDQIFRGDSVHFEFGPAPDGDSLRSGDLHLMLAPVDPSNSDVLAAINPAIDGAFRAGPDGSAQPGIEAAAIWLDGGYLVEAAIPWSVLGVGDPQPGLEFGLNLNISDGDGSGGLEQMVSSNPDRTGPNQARPGTWNSGVLLNG